ncbi:recombinase family protein [Arthrobacter sp. 9V]|uniref:recombinase family protein n=1 Tax=Arthrobacter sp. 9V TaxID=2653132 RepID=UPI003FA47ADF
MSASRGSGRASMIKRLLELRRRGHFGCVARGSSGSSLTGVLNTVTLLRGRGVELRSISDGINSATTAGRLMLNMLVASLPMNAT